MLSPSVIAEAHSRIEPYIHRTPIVTSHYLNNLFQGHHLFFKAEMFQKTGAFKARGALNALLRMKEGGTLPAHIVTVSSGNHAQATAYAASLFNVPVTVYMAHDSSVIKQQATRAYGAEIILVENRIEAEKKVHQAVSDGYFYLPPFDHDDIIAGQGTACYEALKDIGDVNAIFATVGGGGWISGSFLARGLLCPTAHIIGCEPAEANDAFLSWCKGEIVSLSAIPQTIADGARTPSLTPRTFEYVKQCDDFFTATEDDIILWTNTLRHFLKIMVEPTSAVSVACLYHYIQKYSFETPQRFLILLSGGNVSHEPIFKN